MEEFTTIRRSALFTAGLVVLTSLICIFQGSFEAQAQDSTRPRNVMITHVTESLFSVSWVTTQDLSGYVVYGTNPSNLNMTAPDDRGAAHVGDTHHVRIGDYYDTLDSHGAQTAEPALEWNTRYYFSIISDGVGYGLSGGVADTTGEPWEVTTSHELGIADSHIVFGGVYDKRRDAFAPGVLTYLTISDSTQNVTSAPLSTLTSDNGLFGFNLSEARYGNGTAFTWRHGQDLHFHAHGGRYGTGVNETQVYRWTEDWNLQGYERVDLTDNIPPVVSIVKPGDEGGVANATFTIEWEDSDGDDQALVSLHYDMDDSPGGEIPIAEYIDEEDESDSLIFDTSAIPTDTVFHVKVTIRDGFNAPVYDYSTPITIDRLPPAAITDLWAGPGTANGEVELSWTATGDDGYLGNATSYEIRYSTSGIDYDTWEDAESVENSLAPKGPGETENLTIPGLESGVMHYFAVRVSDGASLSPLSNVAGSLPEIDLGPPARITDLTASPGGDTGEVLLQWTATGDDGFAGTAHRYMIRYDTSAVTENNWNTSTDVENDLIPGASGAKEEFTVSGLTPETRYFFALMATDEADNPSEISNAASAEAHLDVTSPRAITDLSAVSGPVNGEVSLSWTAPGDDVDEGIISGYELRYSSSEITESNWDGATLYDGEVQVMPAGNSHDFTVSGLVPGHLYHFALKAMDETPNYSGISNSQQALAYSDETFVVIDSPVEGEVYITTDHVLFDASNSSDVDDNLTFLWTSSIDGGLNPNFGARVVTNLSAGKHLISLWVVNETGEEVARYLNITVIPSSAPASNGPDGEGGPNLPLSIPCLFSLVLLSVVIMVMLYDFKLFIGLRKGHVKKGEADKNGR